MLEGESLPTVAPQSVYMEDLKNCCELRVEVSWGIIVNTGSMGACKEPVVLYELLLHDIIHVIFIFGGTVGYILFNWGGHYWGL